MRFEQAFTDGSTNSAIVEEENVYAKNGVAFTPFLGFQSVDKADAQHIAAVVSTVVSCGLGIEDEVWERKLVVVGSYGAAATCGSRSGVVVLFLMVYHMMWCSLHGSQT